MTQSRNHWADGQFGRRLLLKSSSVAVGAFALPGVLQSRAIAGVANGTYIFCLPGSSGACALAWDALIVHQLDYRTRPCNLVELMPRLRES